MSTTIAGNAGEKPGWLRLLRALRHRKTGFMALFGFASGLPFALFLGTLYAWLTEAEVETLSPLRLPQAPKPLVIAYGTAELPALVADSRALHRLREDAGAPSRLLPLAGHDHFSILDELQSPTGALSLAARTLA